MSRENVELAYRAHEAVAGRQLDALLALMDPEVDFRPLISELEGNAYQGHDGVRRWWEQTFSVFSDFEFELDEVRDLGDVVLAALRVRGHGVGGDAPFVERIWQIAEWRHGKVVWWRVCRSESDALAAERLRH